MLQLWRAVGNTVGFDRPETWTSNLLFQRRTRYRSTDWPVSLHCLLAKTTYIKIKLQIDSILHSSYLASKKRDLRIITASQVLCFSCNWMSVNFFEMIMIMRSISWFDIGRVRLCSRSRFITCDVNSLQACGKNISARQVYEGIAQETVQFRYSPITRKLPCFIAKEQ